MVGSVVMNGMVLSAMPMGEYDKRLTILTAEHGKISAFAKGARKPNSPLLACTQPFSFGEFTLYAGRTSYTVTSAQIVSYFPGLREELSKVYLGMYFCEFADYFTREGNDEREVLKLLFQSLRALESETFDDRLVRRVFELKLISIEGEAPQVFECTCCGAKEELMYFSLRKDGLLCECCKRAEADVRLLSAAASYAMQYIVSTPPAQLYRFSLKEEVLAELEAVVEKYIQKHVNHEMKTLQVLQKMEFLV